MIFNSLLFALFFALVLPTVHLLRNRVNTRNAVLLLASYVFYGAWDWRFLSLIAISTVVDYCCGLYFDVNQQDVESRPPDAEPDRGRRAVLWISIGTNLGILGFFKYYDFFVESAVEGLASLGVTWNVELLHITLPVGISFYTFQTLSYTIDVYRRRMQTERNLLTFATYVAFFPQLVAGPIERAAHLLPQFREPRAPTVPEWHNGWWLIFWGLFKKVVIADNVAGVADVAFGHAAPGSVDVVLGVFAFAVQIYCDFSGYTDTARGIARVMGFDLQLNFNQPYFATNPSDFWKRWHISLSSWLRDYLYIPLGGSRGTTARTYVNLMATMVLGGLWHGAAWTYVAWGVYHGALLCCHRAIAPWLPDLSTSSAAIRKTWFAARASFFFVLVCGSWLLFRADSFETVANMLRALVSFRVERVALTSESDLIGLAACSAFLFAVEVLQWRHQDAYALTKLPVVMRSLVYAGLILAFLVFGEFGGATFIYFQF